MPTKKILDEYKEKRHLYEEYCLVIRNLIEGLLVSKNYKYHISSRIKDPEKLKEKIERKARVGKKYKKLSDIEDLAAIRVIFYLEKDKKRFAIDLDKEIDVKLRFEDNAKKWGYKALHTTVTLGPKRLALNEYRKFTNLKCEVQLTSILYHAWAEIEHDIFYKENETVKKMSKDNKVKLKLQLLEIMNSHIKKATYELEKLVNNVKKLNIK